MTQLRSSRAARPSDVLALPSDRSEWAPPGRDAPDPRRRSRGRWGRGAVLSVVVLVVAGLLWPGGQRTVMDDVRHVDAATEEAVITVLRVYAAEVAVQTAARTTDDIFAVPGPEARAATLRDRVASLTTLLEEVRPEPVAPGTPGQSYIDHGDHDALIGVALQVAEELGRLAYLGRAHDALYGGAGVSIDPDAQQRLRDIAAAAALDGTVAWSRSLQERLAGVQNGPAAATARLAAAEDWAAMADRLGPADGADLAAFLNGVDAGLLDALDGHPVAGPALAALRG